MAVLLCCRRKPLHPEWACRAGASSSEAGDSASAHSLHRKHLAARRPVRPVVRRIRAPSLTSRARLAGSVVGRDRVTLRARTVSADPSVENGGPPKRPSSEGGPGTGSCEEAAGPNRPGGGSDHFGRLAKETPSLLAGSARRLSWPGWLLRLNRVHGLEENFGAFEFGGYGFPMSRQASEQLPCLGRSSFFCQTPAIRGVSPTFLRVARHVALPRGWRNSNLNPNTAH